MNQPAVFSATLGLSPPWQIKDISFSQEEKRMDVVVDFLLGSTVTCSICGMDGKVCSTENELWHHKDFFMFATYLHVRAPIIECPSCGINSVDRPWAAGGSQFVLLDADEELVVR